MCQNSLGIHYKIESILKVRSNERLSAMRQKYLHVQTQALLQEFENNPQAKQAFIERFDLSRPLDMSIPKQMAKILHTYHIYFHSALYLQTSTEAAEAEALTYAQTHFDLPQESTFSDMEICFQEICEANNYHFLGGRTTGYYGAYIWKTEESATFDVEIFDERLTVPVIFMGDFIIKGWLDYYSGGLYGAAGWAHHNGTLYAVAQRYPNKTDQSFLISYLKHEGQHLLDYKMYSDITPTTLEFRAKLVELFYYSDNTKIKDIWEEAMDNPENSHSYASYFIMTLLKKYKP